MAPSQNIPITLYLKIIELTWYLYGRCKQFIGMFHKFTQMTDSEDFSGNSKELEDLKEIKSDKDVKDDNDSTYTTKPNQEASKNDSNKKPGETKQKEKNVESEEKEVDHELEKLRLKKMESLLRQQQKSQRNSAVPTHQDKINSIMQTLMTPSAYQYYQNIRVRDTNVFKRIQQIILPPPIMQQLDVLLAYRARGMLRANIIDLIQVKQLERKILGIGPRITVKKRDGESTDLTSFLKNNK